jgi:hypothetical protein
VPAWISQSKLLNVAHIDNRSTTALDVRFTVDARCPRLPIIDSLQYKMNASTKLRMAAAFLGSSEGLHIVVPNLPRSQPNVSMTPDQQQWYAELNRQRSQYGDIIRAGGGSGNEQRAACAALFTHLELLSTSSPSSSLPLWAPEQLTKTWHDLLITPSAIRANSARQPPLTSSMQDSSSTAVSTPSTTSFTLSLHAASVEASYVIACQMVAYSLVKSLAPSLTTAWKKILGGGVVSGTDSTEPESSDSDKEVWEQQHQSARTQHRNTNRNLGRVRRELIKHITAFTSTPSMVNATAEAYSPITKRPLIALSASLSMRPITRPYVSYVVDNFQSAGCDIHNLENDPTYQKIIHCIPELSPPICYWGVSHRIGNAVVCLWAPAEYSDLVVELNDRLRIMLSSPCVALRISTSMMKKTRRGGIDRESSIMVSLTPETKVSPPLLQTRPKLATSAPSRSSSSASSYATALASGLKRAYDSAALNHHPRKEQRTAPTMPIQPVHQPPAAAQTSLPPSSLLHQHWIASSSLHPMSSAPAGVLVPLPANTVAAVTSSYLESRLIALEQTITAAMESRMNSMFETLQNRIAATVERMMENFAVMLMQRMESQILGKIAQTGIMPGTSPAQHLPQPSTLSLPSSIPETLVTGSQSAHPTTFRQSCVPAGPALHGPVMING